MGPGRLGGTTRQHVSTSASNSSDSLAGMKGWWRWSGLLQIIWNLICTSKINLLLVRKLPFCRWLLVHNLVFR
jgi:hypothetical protein